MTIDNLEGLLRRIYYDREHAKRRWKMRPGALHRSPHRDMYLKDIEEILDILSAILSDIFPRTNDKVSRDFQRILERLDRGNNACKLRDC